MEVNFILDDPKNDFTKRLLPKIHRKGMLKTEEVLTLAGGTSISKTSTHFCVSVHVYESASCNWTPQTAVPVLTACEPSSAGTGRDLHGIVARITGLDGTLLARLRMQQKTTQAFFAAAQRSTLGKKQHLCAAWCGVVLEPVSDTRTPIAGGGGKYRIQLGFTLDLHSHAGAQLLEVQNILEQQRVMHSPEDAVE